MSRRRKVLVSVLVVVLVVLAAAALRVVPVLTGSALPAGATRLHIATAGPNLSGACHTALLSPARVATSGDDLVLVNVESGETIAVVWPAGFAAWRLDGRAVLADPWGSIVGREGDILDWLGGGTGADDAFQLCPFGIPTLP